MMCTACLWPANEATGTLSYSLDYANGERPVCERCALDILAHRKERSGVAYGRFTPFATVRKTAPK